MTPAHSPWENLLVTDLPYFLDRHFFSNLGRVVFFLREDLGQVGGARLGDAGQLGLAVWVLARCGPVRPYQDDGLFVLGQVVLPCRLPDTTRWSVFHDELARQHRHPMVSPSDLTSLTAAGAGGRHCGGGLRPEQRVPWR